MMLPRLPLFVLILGRCKEPRLVPTSSVYAVELSSPIVALQGVFRFQELGFVALFLF